MIMVPDPGIRQPDAKSIKCLMVEDDPADADIFQQMLRRASHVQLDIEHVNSFAGLLDRLRQETFKLLIVDFNLPGTSGLENLDQLAERYPDLPIVVLTDLDDETIATQSLRLGVQDFLSKQRVTPELLTQSIQFALERKKILRKLNQALKRAEEQNQQLTFLATHDTLTGLANRSLLFNAAERAIAEVDRSGKHVAVVYFDVDAFKYINDYYGHEVGDTVLRTIAQRTKQKCRSQDLLARLGGDEFVVLLSDLEDPVQAYSVAQQLHQCIHAPVDCGDVSIKVEMSFGIASYPGCRSVTELLRQADTAMYESKRIRDHFVHFYNHNHEQELQRRRSIELAFPASFKRGEFEILLQPIVSASDLAVCGAEALVRWRHPKIGAIFPEEFIPIAERSTAIKLLFRFAADICTKFLSSLPDSMAKNFRLSLNVAARQLADNTFAKQILQRITKFGIDNSLLCLEITESQIIDNIAQCRQQLELLKSAGIHIALDDYGTGFSSITHLKELPIDNIKIDRSLVHNVSTSPKNLALTAGIIEMAHRLSMTVTAEGIERIEDARCLRELGCDFFQGFLFSKPLPVVEFTKQASALATRNFYQLNKVDAPPS